MLTIEATQPEQAMTFAELFDDYLNEYDAGLLNLPPVPVNEVDEYLEAAEWLNPSKYNPNY